MPKFQEVYFKVFYTLSAHEQMRIVETSGMNEFIDGFFITKDFRFTNWSKEAHFWVPPHKIEYAIRMTKEVEHPRTPDA